VGVSTVTVSASLATLARGSAISSCGTKGVGRLNPASKTINQYQSIRASFASVQVRQRAETLHNTSGLLLAHVDMRRNRGASGEQPTSGIVPSPETVFGNGRVLATDSRTPNPPHGHSFASSLDPITISEDKDEEELVRSQLIPSSPESLHGHDANFKPEVQLLLSPPT
jgi:hypothetical protein